MSAIPSKPLAMDKAIKRVAESYETRKKLTNDPLVLRAVKSIFAGLESSSGPLNSLSDSEKKTLKRLFQDISKTPCSVNPTLVKELQKYSSALPKAIFTPPGVIAPSKSNAKQPSIEEDPLLQAWKGTDANSPTHDAYTRITEYAKDVEELDLPPLDLSDLGLEELPSCLFTDPIFADANISDNKCKKFPEGLTVGSVCNVTLYEAMSEQVEEFKPKASPAKDKALNEADISTHILSFLSKEDQAEAASSNRASNLGRIQILKKEISQYEKTFPNTLTPEIKDKLKNIDTLSQKELIELHSSLENFFCDQMIEQSLNSEGIVLEDTQESRALIMEVSKVIPDDQKESFLQDEKKVRAFSAVTSLLPMRAQLSTDKKLSLEEVLKDFSREDALKDLQALENQNEKDLEQLSKQFKPLYDTIIFDGPSPASLLFPILLQRIPKDKRADALATLSVVPPYDRYIYTMCQKLDKLIKEYTTP